MTLLFEAFTITSFSAGETAWGPRARTSKPRGHVQRLRTEQPKKRSDTLERMKGAAGVAVILLAAIVVFQMALVFGAPLGRAAWGGQHEGVLPKRLRIASGVAALLVYPLIIVAILDSAGLMDVDFIPETGAELMWVFSGLFTLGGIVNLVSRSTLERYWAPVSIAIAICCSVIASTH